MDLETYALAKKYTDAHGGDGALAHHYSKEEHVIGTWIDGKPLYEKTITGTFDNSATTLILNINHNMGIAIDVRGFLIPSDTPTNMVNLENKGNLIWIEELNTGSGNVKVVRGNGSYFGTTPSVYITACYTKTTD